MLNLVGDLRCSGSLEAVASVSTGLESLRIEIVKYDHQTLEI
jgi:hypothetical protein